MPCARTGSASARRWRVMRGDVERLIAAVCAALGVPVGADARQVRRAAATDLALDQAGLSAAARALARGTDTDAACARTIADWLAAEPEERVRTWSAYECVFLTKDRQPRQRNLVSAVAFPQEAAALRAEQARLASCVEREKAAGVAERTAALLRIGAAVLEAYDRRKHQTAALDFDDLIAFTRRLLERPGIAPWVQYKLDQQIDHLMVDEGQDTSPEQWAIIDALCAEFFVGAGARQVRRTLFVVGDEKQSIMSVQGADVASYRRFRQTFEARARLSRQPWREEPLGRSFRSARPILDLVDAVFAEPEARDGVVSGDGWPAHDCFKTTVPGLVELWPLIEVGPATRADGWQLPDEQETRERGETRLAQAIARQIFAWLRDRTPLPSTGQPIRAGDIMILLPRRGILQELLIRELKQLHVPVAGADRLALTDDIAVMDLIALGDVLLLPEDDLSLAAVLRSPLFGLSEEAVFELAHDRAGASLYQRLQAARDRPPFAPAYQRLHELLAQVDFLPPFEFYVRLLGEGGGRRRLLARLGPAAAEPIEAFLAQALAFEQSHPPSMQAFLHWLRADSTELIRDPDRPRDEVRVLTCHGAKGLEAPIVFIADATFGPNTRDRLLWTEQDGLPVWRVGSGLRDRASSAADQAAVVAQQQEHRRLLYVALTRAQERLIVAGWQRRNQSGPTWYDWIEAGMVRLGAARTASPLLQGDVLRYGNQAPCGPAQLSLTLADRRVEHAAPSWLNQRAPVEPSWGRAARPSHLADDEDAAAPSPLTGAGAGLPAGAHHPSPAASSARAARGPARGHAGAPARRSGPRARCRRAARAGGRDPPHSRGAGPRRSVRPELARRSAARRRDRRSDGVRADRSPGGQPRRGSGSGLQVRSSAAGRAGPGAGRLSSADGRLPGAAAPDLSWARRALRAAVDPGTPPDDARRAAAGRWRTRRYAVLNSERTFTKSA